MKLRGLGVAVLALLASAGGSARAQTLFTGSGCSGNTFLFCASWTGTYVSSTSFTLFITNTSNVTPGNGNSAYTQVGVGNVTVADPTGHSAVTGWAFDDDINGFNGFGFLGNQFGSTTTNGINNALLAGTSRTFTFTGAALGTYAQATTAFSAAQIALHDQGTPAGTQCGSSKGVLSATATGGLTGSATCGVSIVPEPSTYAMMGMGLLGVFGFARRRRRA